MASKREKLADLIRDYIGRPAPVEMLDGWDEALQRMAEGEPAPKIAELIVMKVLKAASDPARSNQWAVELVFDRVDGKAIAASSGEGRDEIEDRLDDLSRRHLDDLARLCVASSEAGAAQAEDGAAGQVANPLSAVSSHRAGNTQGASGEPEVEDGPSTEG